MTRTIGKDRERFDINAVKGFRDKVDRLMEKLRAKYPNKQHHLRDRGVFLDWLVDQCILIVDKAGEVSAAIKKLEERKKQLRERERQLDQREEKLERDLRLSGTAKELWLDLVGSGLVSKDEILVTLKTLKELGIDLMEVAQVMRQRDLPGFVAWVKEVEKSCLEAAKAAEEKKKELHKVDRQVEVLKRAIVELQKRKETLEEQISLRERELERATVTVAQVCGMARDLHLYVDYIKQVCRTHNARTVRDLLMEPALVVAGTILEAAAAAYGDREITLIPGLQHPLPMQVRLREIARSLAPPEAYREQQEAELRAKIQAEQIAGAV